MADNLAKVGQIGLHDLSLLESDELPLHCRAPVRRANPDASTNSGNSWMQLTKRETNDGWGRRFVILTLIGLTLGWMGPFGTYDRLVPLERFVFWGISVPLIGLLARFAIRIVVRHGPTAHWPLPVRVIVGSALAGFPGAFVIYMLLSAIHRPFVFDILDLLGTYATVTAITILLAVPIALSAARRRQQAEEIAPQETVSTFFKRVPHRLGTELLSLTAEDHYVRVTTALGSDLILCRLSDAIAEIGAEKGQRVHRSHWVAQGAVASVDRQSGKTALVLKNGESIPVSQSYLPALRAAGWL
jgi:hypothetical protein